MMHHDVQNTKPSSQPDRRAREEEEAEQENESRDTRPFWQQINSNTRPSRPNRAKSRK